MKKIDYLINKQTLITYSVYFVFILLDQITKQQIIKHMPVTVDVVAQTYSDCTPYEIFSWFWLKHVVNFGAAFSIFYGKTYILILFVLLIITGLIAYERRTFKTRTTLFSVSLGLILAGALGNWIDRVRMGYVTDFFVLVNNQKPIWPIFNIADISIDIGVGLFVLYLILDEIKNKKKPDLTEENS